MDKMKIASSLNLKFKVTRKIPQKWKAYNDGNHSDLSWDCLERGRSKQLAIILFKILHNLDLTRLSSLLKATSCVHSHNLRNSKYNLFVPRPSTDAGKT